MPTLDLAGQLGLGTWAVGGHPPAREPLSLERCRDLLFCAAELGFSWIDTAGVYGLGSVERVLGEIERTDQLMSQFTLVTKAGIGWVGVPGDVVLDRRSHRAAVRSDCMDSLERLGVDVLDVLLLHNADAHGVPVVESWIALTELRDEGLVREIGVSNLSVEQLDACRSIEGPAYHQFGVETSAAEFDDLLEWGESHGCVNMVFGILRAARAEGSSLAESLAEWRTAHPLASFVLGASHPDQLRELLPD